MTIVKPVILVFTASYLPGYKAGGILRTIVNTVDHLHKYYDFKVVTLDHDLGDEKAYESIEKETWLKVGNAEVYYLERNKELSANIRILIRNTTFDVIHLNSFFDPVFTIKIICFYRLQLIGKQPVILAPRGEFNSTQLKFKWGKKQLYILLFRFFKLDRRIIYHASDQQEANDISKSLGIPLQRIKQAQDLPKPMNIHLSTAGYDPQREILKIIFLSRISREKNLLYAIEILQKVKANICFHIYGPVEDAGYWEACKALINAVPENIDITYCGALKPQNIDETMTKYDLFFLPTFAESFGHVIAEALTNGLPVLISNGTPWKQLAEKGLGWDIDLNSRPAFIDAIEQFSRTRVEQRIDDRLKRKKTFQAYLLASEIITENIDLYRNLIK